MGLHGGLFRGLRRLGGGDPGGGVAAPVAAFTGTPLSGDAPLEVVFTNTSTNATSWLWEKNDGGGWADFDGTPTAEDPTEDFDVGTWSVRLTATGAGGSNQLTRTDYIDSAWSPALLPGLQPSVQVALSLSLGLLWQDAGKTVPATEDGDPVRVATCPWTGEDYVAASDSARPLLWDEGLWSLAFDGVDDHLTASTATVGSGVAASVAMAVVVTATLGSGRLVYGGGDSLNLDGAGGGSLNVFRNGNAGPMPAGIVVDTNYTLAAVFTAAGTGTYLRVNGTQVGSGTAGTGAVGGVSVGASNTGTQPAAIRLYGAVLSASQLSPDDIVLTETYLSALAP